MRCIKCKAKISDTDKYCLRCGTLFDNGDVERLGDTLDNRLLSFYLNRNNSYDKNFSIGYLFFNFAYAFYKKMYKEGFISSIMLFVFFKVITNGVMIILSSLGFLFLAIIFSLIGTLILNVHYLFHFNEFYVQSAKCRIQNIIKMNGTGDLEKLNELCDKDSRGNLFLSIISIFIFLALFFFL